MNSDTSNLNDTFLEVPIEPVSHPLNRLPGVEHVLDRRKINVLTYNIFLRPPLIKNNRNDFKDERLKDFIRLLGDYDIVCLQEMFGLLNKRKHKLIRCAAKAGFLHYTDSPSPSFFNSYVVDGGLLTLSRFPILATEFKPYPYGIFADSLAQKGVLYNKIEVRGEVLHIFSTHMQASYFGENQRYPILTRADQFATFRKFVETTLKKQKYKDGELVLLLGDFNVDSKKPFIETSKIKYYPGFQEYSHLGRQDFFNEYEAMMCYLSNNHKDGIEDVLLESYGEHPITYAESWINGNNETKPMETVLTRKDDLCSNQSLDYIFNLTPKSMVRKGSRSSIDDWELRRGRLQIVKDSARVEKFLINSKDFTQLSDHYGLVVSLEYKRNEEYGDSSLSIASRSAILDNLQEDQITVNMG